MRNALVIPYTRFCVQCISKIEKLSFLFDHSKPSQYTSIPYVLHYQTFLIVSRKFLT